MVVVVGVVLAMAVVLVVVEVQVMVVVVVVVEALVMVVVVMVMAVVLVVVVVVASDQHNSRPLRPQHCIWPAWRLQAPPVGGGHLGITGSQRKVISSYCRC